MGQTVVIACSLNWGLESFVSSLETVAREDAAEVLKFPGQVQASHASGSAIVVVSEFRDTTALAEDYATNDSLDARFRRDVGGLRFFSVRFNDVDTMRRFLRGLANEAAGRHEVFWIDTDYGWVISSGEFLKRTDEDPAWDWRKPHKAQ
jgi:hypothetical protein